ncbi:MAG: hypothetical protein AVDCRST_MAG54-2918, partial [uncultured Actinomycetospora sp.]
ALAVVRGTAVVGTSSGAGASAFCVPPRRVAAAGRGSTTLRGLSAVVGVDGTAVPARASSAARAAAARSPAPAGRCSGSFARPAAITASKASPRPGTDCDGAGGFPYRCAVISSVNSSTGKGLLPVRHSNRRHASA